MSGEVLARDFNAALWKRFKAGKIRNVYPLEKYNGIIEKIKTMNKHPPCNMPGEYYLLRKFVVANIDGKERLCTKPESCSVAEKTINGSRCDLKFYVALEEIYSCINEAHKTMIHGNKDRIVRVIQKNGIVNITRDTVELFLTFCKVCRPLRKVQLLRPKSQSFINRVCRSPINNISSESEGAESFCLMNNLISDSVSPSESQNSEAYFTLTRCYIDLIDFTSSPDGDYRFVLLYLDLQTNFCVLNPIRCKCSFEIVTCLVSIFTLLGPPQILHSNFDKDFMTSIINEIRQAWSNLVIVSANLNYLEIEEVAVNCIYELRSMLKSWLSENNSHRWSSALKFIQLKRNTAVCNGSAKSPYECLFGKTNNSSSKILSVIDSAVLKEISTEDDLMNIINTQSEQCESLQIALDPNICNFVQSNESNKSSPITEEPLVTIDTSVVKIEPESDTEVLKNGVQDLSESSNDAVSSPCFGKLQIIIKQEKDDE